MSAALVPELYVSDLEASRRFYVGTLGFTERYARAAERFAYLALADAEVMLEEPIGRTWLTAPLERPFGRGINLQIAVADVQALARAAEAAGAAIVQPIEERRYARADDVVVVRQCVVADPDGYLLRLQQPIATEQ